MCFLFFPWWLLSFSSVPNKCSSVAYKTKKERSWLAQRTDKKQDLFSCSICFEKRVSSLITSPHHLIPSKNCRLESWSSWQKEVKEKQENTSGKSLVISSLFRKLLQFWLAFTVFENLSLIKAGYLSDEVFLLAFNHCVHSVVSLSLKKTICSFQSNPNWDLLQRNSP